jgi:hypothetical protein
MGQVVFEVVLDWPLPLERVWEALNDWPSHGDWVPATTVRVLSGDGGVGTEFVARSGWGPLAFDDTMTVMRQDIEARVVHVDKTGPWLLGTAGFELTPTAAGCTVRWFEEVNVPYLPRLLCGPVAAVSRVGFGVALGQLRRRLERSQ